MLEGLDNIDWSRLQHAYGTAEDVPGLIRALLSDDMAIRDVAVYELFGNIYHQGTVYEASAHAIPFLIELMESPPTPDRASIACLLASIANGSGYLEVHTIYERMESKWSYILAREGTTLEAKLKEERAVVESVRREAAKALPLLVPFLSHSEPEIRSSVASAIGAFPDYRTTYLPILEIALAIESDDEVRAEIAQNIARLNVT